MYFTKVEAMVALGRASDYEAFSDRFLNLIQRQPGLMRASTLNSLGYPAKYTTLALWESREAARAFARGTEVAGLLKDAAPQTYATPFRLLEAFEVVHRVAGAGSAGVAYLIDQTVENRQGNVQAYEASRRELFEARQKQGQGFVVNILARFLGGGNRYLVFGAFTDAAAEAADRSTPGVQQFWKDHPQESIPIATETRELYEVLHVARGEG